MVRRRRAQLEGRRNKGSCASAPSPLQVVLVPTSGAQAGHYARDRQQASFSSL